MKHPSSRGYILLFALVVSAVIFTVTTGLTSYVTTSVRAAHHARVMAEALALAEAGMDKAVSELNDSLTYLGESDTLLGNGTFTTVISVVDAYTKRVTSTGYIPNDTDPIATKTITATVSVDTTLIAFNYGVQLGNGGLSMGSGSTIVGNVYANGPVTGRGTITGTVIVASTSAISGDSFTQRLVISGDAHAYSMEDCTVGGKATYYTTSTCSALSSTGDTPPKPELPMPISDEQIAEWEAIAEAGGVINGSYTLTGDQTLGPIKINGDLTIGIGARLNMAGPIWVKGDITFGNNSYFLVAGSAGSQSAVIIADNPENRATEGIVDLSNNVTVAGNGNPSSYPLAISMNTGSNSITMNNNAQSVLLYAPDGTIRIGNGASANQVTARQLILDNNTHLTYVSGLQSASFTSGPGGAWAINRGSYVIVP